MGTPVAPHQMGCGGRVPSRNEQRTVAAKAAAGTSGMGASFVRCSRCHTPYVSNVSHVCRAASVPHNAKAAAVEPYVYEEVDEAEGDIVNGAMQRENLERLFKLTYDNAAAVEGKTSTEALISEVEQLTRDADAVLQEAMQLPGILDEAELLSKSFQNLHLSKAGTRNSRGRARAQKRASRKAKKAPAASQTVASATAQRERPALAVSDSTKQAIPAVSVNASDNRQFSEPSTSRANTSAPTGRNIASIRRSREKKWGRSRTTISQNAVATRQTTTSGVAGADSMSAFFRAVSGTRLLTADDEKLLTIQVQSFLKLEAKFLELKAELGSEPSMAQLAQSLGPDVDPAELKQRWHTGSECKKAMVHANLRLVISVAKKYLNKGVGMQDLVADGITGLMRATEKFDPHKGFKFSTYAHWWIRQAVQRSISDQSRVVRLPSHLVETAASVVRTQAELQDKLEREPTEQELAAAVGMTTKRLRQLLNAYRTPASLNQSINSDDNATLEDMIEDSTANLQDDEEAMRSLVSDLEGVLSSLGDREAGVLRMRYGLGEHSHAATLEEIGVRYNVTRERIRQIESKALNKLRSQSTEMLAEYNGDSLHPTLLVGRGSSAGKRP